MKLMKIEKIDCENVTITLADKYLKDIEEKLIGLAINKERVPKIEQIINGIINDAIIKRLEKVKEKTMESYYNDTVSERECGFIEENITSFIDDIKRTL